MTSRLMLILPLVVGLSAAQSTHVVDANGGPGVGFTSLPAAVAAAATGDTLLVAPGHYDPFHATGKALRIIGAGVGITVIDGPANGPTGGDYVTIDAVPVGAVFRVEGLTIRKDMPAGSGIVVLVIAARLGVYGTSGATFLADVVTEPLTASVGATASGRGLRVAGAFVSAERSTFTGGWFPFTQFVVFAAAGGDGARVETGGTLVADACTFLGGGGSLAVAAAGWSNATGGAGVTVVSGQAGLYRSVIQGGSGTALNNGSGFGAGGAGIAASGTSTVRIAGASVVGGGLGQSGSAGTPIREAALLSTQPAVFKTHAGVTYVLNPYGGSVYSGGGTLIPSPIGLPALAILGSTRPDGALDANATSTLVIDAPNLPASPLALLLAFAPGWSSPSPATVLNELLVDDIGFSVVIGGTLDAFGSASFPFTFSAVAAGLVGVPLHCQAFVLDSVAMIWRGSNPEFRTFRI